MKFNCGPTREEKAKRKEEAYLAWRSTYGRWRKWFAWRPVRTKTGEFRWMEFVWRKQILGNRHSLYENTVMQTIYEATLP